MDPKNESPTDSKHVEISEPLEKKAKLDEGCNVDDDDSSGYSIFCSDDEENAKDDAFYNDGLHCMTSAENQRYDQQINESDGFNVDSFPNVFAFGLITPVTLNEYNTKVANHIGKFAVEDHNKKIEKQGGAMLEFVEPVNLNGLLVQGMMYYLTFKAKVVGSPDDESRVYQTKVYEGLTDTDIEVEIFREKV